MSAELAKAFDAANQHVDLTVSQLNEAAAALNTRADDIDAMADRLRNLADQVVMTGSKTASSPLRRRWAELPRSTATMRRT
ncbi:MAG: hypothetical protein ACLU0O_11785 [Collinsella sp.]